MMKRVFFVSVALMLMAGMAFAQVKPFGNGKVLKILVSQVEVDDKDFNNGVQDFPVLQQFEALTGVKLQIETSNDYGGMLLPRLAAKSNLPDIFVMGGNFDIVKLASDKVIIPIETLIAANAPETVALWKQVPDIKKDTTATDGHVYGYPGRVSPFDNRFNILGMGYRGDWAAKLGIADPKTIDDWEAMLTAFKTKDPNGNGKADELPIGLGGDNNLNSFGEAWGLSPWNDWWSTTKDGKVNFDWYSAGSKDKAKDFVTRMNKWYKAGIIDTEFPTDHGDAIDAKTLSNQVGARLAWTAAFDDWNNQMKKDYPGTAWTVAYPAKGPQGDVGSEQYGPVNNERWMVTTAAKDPALAIKFLNFVFATKEGTDLMNWGVQGVSYTVDKASGAKKYTKVALQSPYGDPGTYLASLGSSRWPKVFPLDAFTAQMTQVTPGYLARLADFDKQGMFRRGFYFGSLPALPAESDKLATKMNDINTYVKEMFLKFIIGKEPIANYDAFVAQLKKLGIEDVIAIKQTQYSRYIK